MANQEQLAILNQGVQVWNRWRVKNSDVTIDLRGVDLSNADLSNAGLRNANLSNADLHYATLNGTTLNGATLGYTTFVAADLSSVRGLEKTRNHDTPHL